jgi:hypothetical protein
MRAAPRRWAKQVEVLIHRPGACPRPCVPGLPRELDASSLAPGLQWHPVRMEIPAMAVSRATARSSTTRPPGSSRLKAMVPPRSRVLAGPRIHAIGAPLPCRSAASRSMSQPVRHITRRWITSIPMPPTQDSPASRSGIWPKLTVPVLEPGVAGGKRMPAGLRAGEVDRPAANQGRHSGPSASRRAIRQPTPVG